MGTSTDGHWAFAAGHLARDKIIAAVLLTIVGGLGVAVLVATIPQHSPASPRGHAPTIYPDT